MDKGLISIIIPVYKTEKYLRQCVESVLAQTYGDIQVVLVDDGSPDGCGDICDEFARADARVKVVHQENAGLSAAWNAGLRLAEGEFVGFVDSDDFVEPDMFEYRLRGLEEADADVAVCGIFDEYSARTETRSPGEKRTLDTDGVLAEMELNTGIQSYVWNKLWRRFLFDGIEFPGRTSGDIAVAHLLFERAARGVALLPEPKYHYRFLAESITGDRSLKRSFNFVDVFRKRREDLWERRPALHDLLDTLCVQAAVRPWCACGLNPKEARRDYAERLRETAEFSKAHYKTAKRLVKLGITGRAVMSLTRFDRPWAYALSGLLSRLYRLKHERPL